MAAQVEALYAQADWVNRQSFPQTAEGQYLDYHAGMRSIERTAAVRATGTLRFYVRATLEAALEIPEGTVCLTGDGVRYETTQTVSLAAGATYADAPAQAVEAGAAGNTGENTVLSMSVPPAGIVRCGNPSAFTGGADAENDDHLRVRILDSFQRLPNGANAAFYEEQALRVSGVAAARAVGRARGIGTVDVYVATTAGLPDAALISEIQQALEEKREIAVDVQVKAPTAQAVHVQLTLEIAEGAVFDTVKAAVDTAVRGYFTGARLGKPVLLSELHALLHSVEGLENYHILTPTGDTASSPSVLPALGTLSISAAD